jgi:hypothetical protein
VFLRLLQCVRQGFLSINEVDIFFKAEKSYFGKLLTLNYKRSGEIADGCGNNALKFRVIGCVDRKWVDLFQN